MRQFSKDMGLPTMKELDLDKDLLKKVAELAMKDDCAMFIPKETNSEIILELLYRAYER